MAHGGGGDQVSCGRGVANHIAASIQGGGVGGGGGRRAGGADAASEILSDNQTLTELEPLSGTEHVSGSGGAQALEGAVSPMTGSKLDRKTLDTQSDDSCPSAHMVLLAVGLEIVMPATHITTTQVHANDRAADRVSRVWVSGTLLQGPRSNRERCNNRARATGRIISSAAGRARTPTRNTAGEYRLRRASKGRLLNRGERADWTNLVEMV